MGGTYQKNLNSVHSFDVECMNLPPADFSDLPLPTVYNFEKTTNISFVPVQTIDLSALVILLAVEAFRSGISILINELGSRGGSSYAGSITEIATVPPSQGSPAKSGLSSNRGSQKAGGSEDGDGKKPPPSVASSSHQAEFMTLQELLICLIDLLERKKRKLSNSHCLLILRARGNPEYKAHLEELGITIIYLEHQTIYKHTDPAFGDNVLIVHDCTNGHPRWVVLVQHNNHPDYLVDNSRPIRDKVEKHIDALQSHRGSAAVSENNAFEDEGPSGLPPQQVSQWLHNTGAAARSPLYPHTAITSAGAGPSGVALPPIQAAQLLSSLGLSNPGHNTLNLHVAGSNVSAGVHAPHNQITHVDQAAGANQDLKVLQATSQTASVSNSNGVNLDINVNNTVEGNNPLPGIAAGILAAIGAVVLANSLGPGVVTLSRRGQRRVHGQLGIDRGQQDFSDAVIGHNSQLSNLLNQIKLPAAITVVPDQPLAIENSPAFQEGQSQGFLEAQRSHGRQHPSQKDRISGLNQPTGSSSSRQRPPRGVSPGGVTMGVLSEVLSLVLYFALKRKKPKK